MDCDCDYEEPKVFSASHPRARKVHRCDECRGTIRPGETYWRGEGLWDDWRTYKRCADCLVVLCDIEKIVGDCACIAFGELEQWLVDSSAWSRSDECARLAVVLSAFRAAQKTRRASTPTTA